LHREWCNKAKVGVDLADTGDIMARMIEGNPKGLESGKTVTTEPQISADATVEETGLAALEASAGTTEETAEETTVEDKEVTEKETATEDTETTEETVEFEPPKTYVVKGQEYEYPPWALDLMKDEESTKQFQEMFEKVGGFDHVKNDREVVRKEYDELLNHVSSELMPVVQQVNAANQFIQNGDFASFFQICGIPMQRVLEFSLQYAQMNPAQRASLVQSANANMQAYQNSIQQNSQMNSLQSQLVAAREREVSMVLSRPDVVAISRDLDARFGRVGVLREEMIKRGQFYHTQGKDISAEQALNEVITLAGITPGQAMTAGNNGVGKPQNRPGTGTVQRQQKQVIRNVGAGGKTPARPVIKNLDDLKKKRDQLAAAGR